MWYIDHRPPQLDVNFTLPLHRRATYAKEPMNVTIPVPAAFVQTPVRDTLLVTMGEVTDV